MACAAGDEADESASSDAVIGGSATREGPEVGMVSFSGGSWCTATLIAPRVAITASHCMKYRTRDVTGNYGSLKLEAPGGGSRWFTVDRMRAFAPGDLGDPDVALLRLANPVPASVAVPASIATQEPSNQTQLTLFGYGCNDDWEHQTGGGTKRKLSFRWGDRTNNLCPGDSGGPVRIGTSGAVLLINSGYVDDWWSGRRDVFGHVPKAAALIQNQQRAWSAADPTQGVRAEYFDDSNLSGEPKVTRVDGRVDFEWGEGSPDRIVGGNDFAVRWSGTVEPRFSETYTLETYADDGVRLYVDNVRIIDDWNAHSPESHSGGVSLTAGRRHAIRLEYFEKGGGATARLYWSSPRQGREIIPTSQLRP